LADKIELEILGLSTSQAQSGSFALVLGETKGNRRLPIIIGMFEAQSIAIEIEKIKPNRPLTHDLFKELAQKTNMEVKEVLITSLKEGVFFSKIVVKTILGEEIELDSRPSDAIAISLRFNAPIYTLEAVMNEAGIILGDDDEDFDEAETTTEPQPDDTLSTMPLDEIKHQLDEAIANEDYETAAKLRDELSKRNPN